MLHVQSFPPSRTPSPFCKGDDIRFRLKVGILLDSGGDISASNWGVLEALLAADFVEVAQVFEKYRYSASCGLPVMQRLLLSCYKFVEHGILSRVVGVPTSRTVGEARILLVDCAWTSLGTGDSDGGISESAPDRGSPEAQLDVIVCLILPDCARLLSGIAKYGVWWIAPIGQSDHGLWSSADCFRSSMAVSQYLRLFGHCARIPPSPCHWSLQRLDLAH